MASLVEYWALTIGQKAPPHILNTTSTAPLKPSATCHTMEMAQQMPKDSTSHPQSKSCGGKLRQIIGHHFPIKSEIWLDVIGHLAIWMIIFSSHLIKAKYIFHFTHAQSYSVPSKPSQTTPNILSPYSAPAAPLLLLPPCPDCSPVLLLSCHGSQFLL